MIEKENVIKIFITTDDVSKEESDSCYIVDGIENVLDVINKLQFNGNESLFVHIRSSISTEIINKELIMLCKIIKDKGFISSYKFTRMGNPIYGGRFYTTFDENNLLKEERYMITYIKE